MADWEDKPLDICRKHKWLQTLYETPKGTRSGDIYHEIDESVYTMCYLFVRRQG